MRTLSIYNIHTKKTTTATFKRDGKFIPEGLQKLNYAMRDWRRNEPTKMDPDLIDLIWEIHQELGSQKPVHLISGYRSRRTNNGLRRSRGGQARNSRHILGKAADIHFPDVSMKKVRNSALIRQRGGVGYYPKSAIVFVHVDTGRVRHWPRLRRRELAELFPSGRSKHVPSDRRPLTKRDGRLALARLKKRHGKNFKNFIGVAKATKPRQPDKPKVILAGFTPPSLPFGLGGSKKRPAMADVTGSIVEPAAGANGNRPIETLDTASIAPGGKSRGASRTTNLFKLARVFGTTEFDEEHPEGVYDRPFPVLPLMADASVARTSPATHMTHPKQDKIRRLLAEPASDVLFQFGPGTSAYERLLPARSFTGRTPEKFADALPESRGPERPLPARKPQRLIRTASR